MERFAGALHHLGVRKGDRVTIFAHNGMDYLVGHVRVLAASGAIAALVNVKLRRPSFDYYFADHTPSVVIYTHDMGAPVRAAAAECAFDQAPRLHGRPAGGRAFAARASRRRPRAAARPVG